MLQNVSLTKPQDSSDMEAVNRRIKMAEALQAQSLQPIQSVRPDSPISWTQGLAKMLQARFAREGLDKAEGERTALVEQTNQRQGADMSLLAQALQGRQAQPQGLSEDASGNVTQQDSIPGQSPVQSLGQAIPMMSPQMQGVGLNAMMGAQGRQDQQQFQRQTRQDQQRHQQGAQDEARLFREMEADKQRDFQREMVKERAAGDRPFYQFLPSSTGYMAGNARTGQVQPVQHQGQNVVPAAQDPNLQGQIAQQKAGGKETGQTQVQAQFDLPRVVNNANNSLSLIDQMVGSEDGSKKEHPGFQSAVGLRVPGLGMIPGSDTSNFNTLLDQVKGGAFLEAFNSLKGGGQITEVEGKKATDAITRMSNAQSEKEFRAAAREYQNIIKLGVQRAEKKTGKYSGPERRVPTGVDPALWSVMTPEEKAAWSQ